MSDIRLGSIYKLLHEVLGREGKNSSTDVQLLERFATSRDDAAFEVLVYRHSRTVWSACRRVLSREHDIEDAFQATFLILTRKAGSVAWKSSVAGWLRKVARRVALQAKAKTSSQATLEQQRAAAEAVESPTPACVWQEVRSVLNEEIEQLPCKYRLPFVLCHLEGKTNAEVSRELSCPESTIASRLAWARQRLAKQLSRRGVTLPAGLGAAVILDKAVAIAAVPGRLISATVRAGLAYAANGVRAGIISAEAVSLAEGVVHTMLMTKIGVSVGLVMFVGLLAGGTGFVVSQKSPPTKEVVNIEEMPGRIVANTEEKKTKTRQTARVDSSGDPLPPGAVARIGSSRLRQADVEQLAFLADGKSFVACGNGGWAFDNTIRVWDMASGKELRRLQGYPEGVTFLAYSPISQLVAFRSSSSPNVRLWDAVNGKEVLVQKPVACELLLRSSYQSDTVMPCPDGKLVALQQKKLGSFCLREVDTGKVRVEGDLDDPDAIVMGVAWPTDCGGLALNCYYPKENIASDHGKSLIHIWDLKLKRTIWKLQGITGEVLHPMIYSPNGHFLAATGFSDHTVHVWDIGTGKELCQYKVRFDGLLAFSPDSKILITVSDDNEMLVLRELSTGKEVRQKIELSEHDDRLRAAVFSPDKKMLLLGGGCRIRRWDISRGEEAPNTIEMSENVSGVTLSPDGRLLASCDGNRAIRLYDAATGQLLQTWDQPNPRPTQTSLAFTPDGQRLVTASYRSSSLPEWLDGWLEVSPQWLVERLDIWLMANSQWLDEWFGKWLEEKCIVQVRNVNTGHMVRQFSPSGVPNRSIFLTPDGKEVVLEEQKELSFGNDHNRVLFFYDWDSGKRTSRTTLSDGVGSHVTLAPNGQTLAVGNKLWNRTTGQCIRTLEECTEGRDICYYAAFAPDSQTLAVSDTNLQRGLSLLDVRTGKIIWKGQPFAEAGNDQNRTSQQHLTFTPDGRLLITERQGMIHLWETATGQEVHRINGHDIHVESFAISADGQRLVSQDRSGTALIWDMKRLLPDRANLTPKQLPALWDDLGSPQAARAFRARLQLAAHPALALSMFNDRLHPVPPPDPVRLKRLLADLDSEQFATREQANTELAKLGESAEPAMRQLVERPPSLEVGKYAQRLLEKVPAQQLHRARAIAVLEDIADVPSRKLLESLAGGLPGARLTEDARVSLQRLNRRPH